MKSLKYFGYVFALISIVCFWVGIAESRGEYSIVAIVIGCFSIMLIIWNDDDIRN
jgi:hypothetical protein